jgi:suppressor for copper-sensitivity B
MSRFCKIIGSFVLFTFLLIGGAQLGWAQSSEWKGIYKAQVRLVSATSALGNHEDILLGLEFKLAPDWKVYWRSPGDAGFPPEINWEGSENLISAEMKWPRPERFMVLGLETIGYKKHVVYPITAKISDPNSALNIKAHVRFLTCSEVCVPVETDLELSLPTGKASASEHAQTINQFNSLVPLDAKSQGFTLQTALLYLDPDGSKGTLRLRLHSDHEMNEPDALNEGPLELAFFKPKLSLSRDKKDLLIDAPLDGLQFLKDGFEDKNFILTLMDGMQAVELHFKAEKATGPLPTIPEFVNVSKASNVAISSPLSLLSVLGLAVLGGLILNLMPCVLPVLSLKVLGLVGHGGGKPRTVRLSFLASSAGILFSFLLLAGILIAMKSAGASIGWGIQFQQPLFLIALSLIVVLFACNMWGFFEINLPSWLSDMGARPSHTHGLGGHFMTGAFATLLATPCSAPFLGTAVGFALSRGAFDILWVFSALGFGLAIPYLLIAAFPSFATRLPKPGAWMITLRKILALFLLATAIWLISVLVVQIGLNAALILSAILVLFICVLAFQSRLSKLTLPLALSLFIAAFFVPALSHPDPISTINKQEAEKIWAKFDQDKITQIVQGGGVVFVDVTAKWCITCQVNKNLVLYRGDVFKALSSPAVIAMKADWTNPDETITAYLARFGRYAIPFNAVYGPGAPEGIVLPELLNEEAVLKALSKAKG